MEPPSTATVDSKAAPYNSRCSAVSVQRPVAGGLLLLAAAGCGCDGGGGGIGGGEVGCGEVAVGEEGETGEVGCGEVGEEEVKRGDSNARALRLCCCGGLVAVAAAAPFSPPPPSPACILTPRDDNNSIARVKSAGVLPARPLPSGVSVNRVVPPGDIGRRSICEGCCGCGGGGVAVAAVVKRG